MPDPIHDFGDFDARRLDAAQLAHLVERMNRLSARLAAVDAQARNAAPGDRQAQKRITETVREIRREVRELEPLARACGLIQTP